MSENNATDTPDNQDPFQMPDLGTYSEHTLASFPEGRLVGSLHVGPLPSPETLAAYEANCPGAAREILDAAKENQKHRHNTEKQTLSMAFQHQKSVFEWHERKQKIDSRFAAYGQWISFALVLTYFLLIGYVATLGHVTVAAVGFGAAAFSALPRIISIFVRTDRRKPGSKE